MSSNSLTLIVVVRFAIFFFPRNCLWNGNHDCERSSPASLRIQAKQRGFLAELKSPAMVMMKLLNITPGKIATDAWREDSSRSAVKKSWRIFAGRMDRGGVPINHSNSTNIQLIHATTAAQKPEKSNRDLQLSSSSYVCLESSYTPCCAY